MTTSFFKRWSEHKSQAAIDKQTEVAVSSITENTTPITKNTTTQTDSPQLQHTLVEPPETATESSHETTAHAPQEMPIAELLVSEVSENLKKAALRKLFLSQEFNVRDGLDDYDDDYHNLTPLSEKVAETLRNWITEETEATEENLHSAAHQTTDSQVTDNRAKQHNEEENPGHSLESTAPEKVPITNKNEI